MRHLIADFDAGQKSACRKSHHIGTDKRARVQERYWAHFVSAIRLSKSSPSRTRTPKPAAGLRTEVENDKASPRALDGPSPAQKDREIDPKV
jgi:hypothetical protein